MPMYGYFCADCGHEFDDLKTVANRREPTEKPCPKCGAEGTVDIKVSAAAITSSDGNFLSKVPDGFKDRLREIKKTFGNSTIDV